MAVIALGAAALTGCSASTREDGDMTAMEERVVGGTGAFLGVSGEVTTTRNGDGSYSHRSVLIKPR